MIKYNNKTINDFYFDTSNLVKVYRNNAVCYYKISGGGDTPKAHTEIEYIEYSGGSNNYGGLQLLTNVTNDYYFEVECQALNFSGSMNIVTQKSSVEVVSYQMGLEFYNNMFLDYGGGRLSTTINSNIQKARHTYGAGFISGSSYTNKLGVKIDGNITATKNTTVTVENLPYLVGCIEYSGHTASDVKYGDENNDAARIYSVKIYKDYGDTLVGDYIPVIDLNNVVTLYDKISGNYATPFGTLLAGPIV